MFHKDFGREKSCFYYNDKFFFIILTENAHTLLLYLLKAVLVKLNSQYFVHFQITTMILRKVSQQKGEERELTSPGGN